MGYTTCDLLTR